MYTYTVVPQTKRGTNFPVLRRSSLNFGQYDLTNNNLSNISSSVSGSKHIAKQTEFILSHKSMKPLTMHKSSYI